MTVKGLLICLLLALTGSVALFSQELAERQGDWFVIRHGDPTSGETDYSFTATTGGHPGPWSADHPPLLVLFFSLRQSGGSAAVELRWPKPVSRLVRPNLHYYFGRDLGPDLWMVTPGGALLQPESTPALLFVRALAGQKRLRVESLAADGSRLEALFRVGGLRRALLAFPDLALFVGIAPSL